MITQIESPNSKPFHAGALISFHGIMETHCRITLSAEHLVENAFGQVMRSRNLLQRPHAKEDNGCGIKSNRARGFMVFCSELRALGQIATDRDCVRWHFDLKIHFLT